jgi:hypothetical protein
MIRQLDVTNDRELDPGSEQNVTKSIIGLWVKLECGPDIK